jgi:hypothetical protein
MNYENFCSQILESNPKIRFATVYDQWAVKVGGGLRTGLTSLLSEHKENELVSISILDWKARKEMSKWLGKTKYTMAEYDLVKRFTLYLGDDHLLLVSADKDVDTDAVVDEIIKIYYKNR